MNTKSINEQKLSEQFFDPYENEVDIISLDKEKHEKVDPIESIFQVMGVKTVGKEIELRVAVVASSFNFKFMQSKTSLLFALSVEEPKLDFSKNILKIKCTDMVSVVTFSLLKFDSNNNSQNINSNSNSEDRIDFELLVENTFEIYLINEFKTLSNPILFLNLKKIKLSFFKQLFFIQLEAVIKLKRYYSIYFEPIIEKLGFKASLDLLDNKKSIDLNISSFDLNFSPKIINSLLELFQFVKNSNKISQKIFNIVIDNKLGIEINADFKKVEYKIDDEIVSIPIKLEDSEFNDDIDLVEFFNYNYKNNVEMIINNLKQNLKRLEINEELKNFKLDNSSFFQMKKNDNKIRFKMNNNIGFIVDLNSENSTIVPTVNPEYSFLVTNNYTNNVHYIELRPHLEIVNKVNNKLNIILFKKAKRNSLPRSLSFTNLKPKMNNNFSHDIIATFFIEKNEKFTLPYISDISNTFIKISSSFDTSPSQMHNLHNILKLKFASVTIVAEENLNLIMKVKKFDNIHLIKIEGAVKIENKIPINLNLYFKESNTKLESLGSKMTFEMKNSESDFNHKFFEAESFSKNTVNSFFIKNFPFLYFNNISFKEDFIKLKEKIEFKLVNGKMEKTENTNPQGHEEEYLTLMNIKKAKNSKHFFNVFLHVKNYFDQIKLKIFSEFLIINETLLNLKVSLEEHKNTLEVVSLENKKLNEIIRSDDMTIESLKKKQFFSLLEIEEDFFSQQILKLNVNHLKTLTGDLYNSQKQFTIESSKSLEKHNLFYNEEKLSQTEFKIDKQLIKIKILKLPEKQSHRGLILFYYPFFITNQTGSDLVLKIFKKSEDLLIMYNKKTYTSQDLLRTKKVEIKNTYHIKINSNDYNWCFPFELNHFQLNFENCFFKIKSVNNQKKDLNIEMSVVENSISKLILLKENKVCHIRVENQTNSNLFLNQNNCEDTKEIVYSKSVKEYFWSNTMFAKIINIYFKARNIFKLIDKIDVSKNQSSYVYKTKNSFLKDIKISVLEEKENFVLIIKQEETLQVQNQSRFLQIKNFFANSIYMNNYSSFVKKKSNKLKFADFLIEVKIKRFSISFCDENNNELLFITFGKSKLIFTEEKQNEIKYQNIDVEFKEFQADVQMNSNLHNVG